MLAYQYQACTFRKVSVEITWTFLFLLFFSLIYTHLHLINVQDKFTVPDIAELLRLRILSAPITAHRITIYFMVSCPVQARTSERSEKASIRTWKVFVVFIHDKFSKGLILRVNVAYQICYFKWLGCLCVRVLTAKFHLILSFFTKYFLREQTVKSVYNIQMSFILNKLRNACYFHSWRFSMEMGKICSQNTKSCMFCWSCISI